VFDLRDLHVPVVGAPMAGGPSTPPLAAAISGAGGLGFLAAGYKAPDTVAAEVAAVRRLGTQPFGLNLFVVRPYVVPRETLDDYRRALEPEATRLGVELGVPRWDDDHWQAKLELVLDLRQDLVSFTFGCPSADLLCLLAKADVLTAVTVTTVDEARDAVARGAATLAVQGPDAGGHRGTWNPDTDPVGTELVAAVLAAVDVPVAAGGGVTDPDGVAALLAGGAVAAQVGTAYLLADEAGTNPVHRAALTDPDHAATAFTRAYTGRWARGLAIRFIAEHEDAPAGYPQLHHLTAPLRAAAVAAGDREVAHMWGGTGHLHAPTGPAADITVALAP
jgi:nitronate monooxygenase